MVTSVHVATIGARAALFRAPKPADVPGLISADAGLTGALSGSVLPRPNLKQVAMIAFWEDEAALDGFLASHKSATALRGGWQARLEPLRAHGDWPGLDPDIRRTRTAESEGPVVVTTLGRLKLSQAIRFLKTSAPAEERVMQAPGMLWATGFGQPPFVATISIWESAQASIDYAYGEAQPEHAEAIGIDRARTFHREKAFIRYLPLRIEGDAGGSNPVPGIEL